MSLWHTRSDSCLDARTNSLAASSAESIVAKRRLRKVLAQTRQELEQSSSAVAPPQSDTVNEIAWLVEHTVTHSKWQKYCSREFLQWCSTAASKSGVGFGDVFPAVPHSDTSDPNAPEDQGRIIFAVAFLGQRRPLKADHHWMVPTGTDVYDERSVLDMVSLVQPMLAPRSIMNWHGNMALPVDVLHSLQVPYDRRCN